MVNKLNFYFLIVNLIYFSLSEDYDYCGQLKSEEECINSVTTKNNTLIPFYQGRCCWKDNLCSYIEKPIPSFLEYSGYKCGTKVEKCLETKLTNNIFDKISCNSIIVEIPFKCCYIKYEYHALCYPVDVSHKSVFKLLENHLKPYYGFFDSENIEIYCNTYFIKVGFILFLNFLIFI